MSTLGRNSFVSAGLAFGVLTLVATNGCSEAQKALNEACCKDFQVGADMSAVSWENSDPKVEANFSALAQGVGDFASLSAALAVDVAGSCKSIALALDPTTANDARIAGDANVTVDKAVGIWCELASKSIVAAKNSISATANLTAVVEPPKCEVQADFQAKCDAKCEVNVSADCQVELGNISARCEPGHLSGSCDAQCKGSCTGTASASVDCAAECTGQCEGTCEASAGATVDCNGSCTGTCNGTCVVNGTPSNVNGTCAGECRGSCSATCKMNAGAKASCKGKCTGKCDATCKSDVNVEAKCSGTCQGSCSVDFKEPKCDVALTPPSAKCNAQASADCSANCQASANARANCTPPRVQVGLSVAVTGDAQAKLDTLVRILETNLPGVANVFTSRINDLTKLGASLTTQATAAASGGLSAKSVACGAQISFAITPAVTNLTATINAATALGTAIKLN